MKKKHATTKKNSKLFLLPKLICQLRVLEKFTNDCRKAFVVFKWKTASYIQEQMANVLFVNVHSSSRNCNMAVSLNEKPTLNN